MEWKIIPLQLALCKQSLDPNAIEHLWDVVEREIYSMKVHIKNLQELYDAIINMDQNPKAVFQICGIHDMKN